MRLCKRYQRLVARGKPPQKAVIAIARELVGFLSAVIREGEQHQVATR
jgi:transposase